MLKDNLKFLIARPELKQRIVINNITYRLIDIIIAAAFDDRKVISPIIGHIQKYEILQTEIIKRIICSFSDSDEEAPILKAVMEEAMNRNTLFGKLFQGSPMHPFMVIGRIKPYPEDNVRLFMNSVYVKAAAVADGLAIQNNDSPRPRK